MSHAYPTVPGARPRLGFRSWLEGIALGAAVGLFTLGVGGRVAMRVIGLQERSAAAFTVQGTITVVLLGIVSGIAGGVVQVLLLRFLPHAHWVRRALYAAFLLLITLRGLRPANALSLSLFLPLVLVYGVLVAGLLERRASQVGRT